MALWFGAASPPVPGSLRRSRRLLSIAGRTGQRSVALGALLLLGSSLTASAIVHNTLPTITSATLSSVSVSEGAEIVVNVQFTDPDPEDRHPIIVRWDIEPGTGGNWRGKEEVLLPPGQFSFQTTAKIADDGHDVNGNPSPIKLEVWVSDEQPGNDNYDGAGEVVKQFYITVQNVAPYIRDQTVKVTKGSGKSAGAVVVEGRFDEPGRDTVHVAANWGDGSPSKPKSISECTVDQQTRTFSCEHTYATSPARTYQITLRAVDEDGGEDTATTSVQMP